MNVPAGNVIDLDAYRASRLLSIRQAERRKRAATYLLWYPGVGFVKPLPVRGSISSFRPAGNRR